jgi:hypothetical protein
MVPLDPATLIITAIGPLVGVLLGSLLSYRNQGRLLNQQATREIAEARRGTYLHFLESVRHYVAYTQSDEVRVTAVPHQHKPGVSNPVLDTAGTALRREMDAAQIAVRLIATSLETVDRAHFLVTKARAIAAARADHPAGAIPQATYDAVWAAERVFVDAARAELSLPTFDPSQPSYAPDALSAGIGSDSGTTH